MKYILIILLFFSCQKKDPYEPAEPRVDAVTILKDSDGWYIKITARIPTDYHRMVRVLVFYPEEVWYLVKIPAGKTAVTKRLDAREPLRWEVKRWGEWPYPD